MGVYTIENNVPIDLGALGMPEPFIFQYDDNRFEKVYDKNTIKNESYSDFLNRDLKELTKDFYKYVYETSI